MTPPSRWALVLSCEHACATVPAALQPRFDRAADVLASHRGWDLGAAALARRLARSTGAPLVLGQVSRLVVDLNRSEGHRALFSEFTRDLPAEERAALVLRHHRPHWSAVETAVARASRRARPVLHLGVHSFTPVLRGQVRRVDVGLLYDPARRAEARWGRSTVEALTRALPELRVRANQPYRGTADGVTTSLRKRWPASRYWGLELEVNQALLAGPDADSARPLIRRLLTALGDCVLGRDLRSDGRDAP